MPAIVGDSRSSILTDPLRNFKFQINISHQTSAGSMSARLGFMTLSGLSVETDLIAYRQGGFNTTTQKMPGQTNYPPLSLSRGMIAGTPDEYLWFKEIFDVIAGKGTGPNPRNPNSDFRADIDIYIMAHPWTKSTSVPVRAKYHVYNSWPQSLAWSDLDAGGNGLMMESMVLQHEGFGLVYASSAITSDVANSAVV
jgi:phage tail-like protein